MSQRGWLVLAYMAGTITVTGFFLYKFMYLPRDMARDFQKEYDRRHERSGNNGSRSPEAPNASEEHVTSPESARSVHVSPDQNYEDLLKAAAIIANDRQAGPARRDLQQYLEAIRYMTIVIDHCKDRESISMTVPGDNLALANAAPVENPTETIGSDGACYVLMPYHHEQLEKRANDLKRIIDRLNNYLNEH